MKRKCRDSLNLNTDSGFPINHRRRCIARMFVHQQGRRVSTSQRHYQMINSTLHAFVARVRRSGRLNFGDIKELQRDILPDGLIAREEAAALLALDRAITQAHPAWSGYLVTTLVDFVVWGVRPTGSIDRETAR